MTPLSSLSGVPGFMDAHQSFGGVTAQPYDIEITIAASAIDGKGRVAVHARTTSGHNIGGLMGTDEARELVTYLEAAITHADTIAQRQLVASIPELEARLAKAKEQT